MKKWKKGDVNPETGLIFHSHLNKKINKIRWIPANEFDELMRKEKEYYRERYNVIKKTDLPKRRLAWADRLKKDPLGMMLYSSRGGARNRGIVFNIIKEDIVELWEKQKGLCFYTGVSMIKELKTNSPYQVSLDRKDSSLGYEKDNIVLCCQSINFAKSDFSNDMFMLFIKDIANQFKTK